MHFQISLSLWELQIIRDWFCVKDITETSLNRLLLFLILKSSHRSYSVEKDVLKSFTGKLFCWSLFLIKSIFISLNFDFLFCFWENVLFNSRIPCYVICSCRKTFQQPLIDVLQKGVLKHFAIFTGKNLCWSLFLIKFQDWSLHFYSRRHSNAGVFLWILRNF